MRKAASDVRREAARLAREWAKERERCGDPEGAGCFRDLAREIDAIRLRTTQPKEQTDGR